MDSEAPEYEFSFPEVWSTWNWSTNYPNYEELRAYFDHVDKVLDIKKDCSFNTVVVGADFDTKAGRWNIATEDGRNARAKYFVLGTGFVSSDWMPTRMSIMLIRPSLGRSPLHPQLARH